MGTYQAYLRRYGLLALIFKCKTLIPILVFLFAVFSTPAHLAYSLQDAKAHNYALGVKLVRGAYHPHEIAAHSLLSSHTNAAPDSESSPSISPDQRPPVWLTKRETDECYNACARLLVREIKADIDLERRANPNRWAAPVQRLGVLFGTHNWESCDVILNELVNCGLGVAVVDKDEGGSGKVTEIGTDLAERMIFGHLYGKWAVTDYLHK
jgi:proline dehydrogenase